MYPRKKTIRGKVRHYLVKSYRDKEGRPRQRVAVYLGEHTSVRARKRFLYGAVEFTREQIRRLENEVERSRYAADYKKVALRPPVRGESKGLHANYARAARDLAACTRKLLMLERQIARLNQAMTKL